MTDPLSNQDVAIKNYEVKNAITIDGGVGYGDIKLSVGFDLIRSLQCKHLTSVKTFTLLLGRDTNMLTHTISNTSLSVPIK